MLPHSYAACADEHESIKALLRTVLIVYGNNVIYLIVKLSLT